MLTRTVSELTSEEYRAELTVNQATDCFVAGKQLKPDYEAFFTFSILSPDSTIFPQTSGLKWQVEAGAVDPVKSRFDLVAAGTVYKGFIFVLYYLRDMYGNPAGSGIYKTGRHHVCHVCPVCPVF